MNKDTNQKLLSKRSLWISCLVVVLLVGCVFTVGLLKEKNIEIATDSQIQSVATRAETVEEVLQEAKITLAKEDTVSPSLATKIKNGDQIKISKAVEISLSADWQVNTFKVLPVTVGEVLKEKGVTLSEYDKVTPSVDTKVEDGMAIEVKRVKYLERTDTVAIQPKEIRENNPALEKGQKKVVQAGSPGQQNITYEIIYVDGEPISKTEVARETVKPVKDRVVSYGTMQVASRGGRDFSFSKSFTVKATAYTYTGNRTATGTNPRVGVVAVDPRVIPLGTRLYVEGYGYARAEDTGGAIKGNKIDVFLTTESACRNWGVKSVKIYVLD